MVDIAWPADLMPVRCMFYLQPHVGGSESPLTRVRKTYGLSAPRWVARLGFRAGYEGPVRIGDPDGFGPRLDSLIADLKGGLNFAVLHDVRRPRPLGRIYGTPQVASGGAAKGATSMVVTGLAANGACFMIGDYVGGDGRPHMVSAAETIAAGGRISGAGTLTADGAGRVTVGFNPPLSRDIAAGTRLAWPVTGPFQLVSEDAGANDTEVGQPTDYVLDFVEDLR